VLTNLVRVARHRFPAYVGIRPIRLTDVGAIYWTAYRQYSDGKKLEVFRWKAGGTTDLGSPGRGRNVGTVNNRGRFLVETMPLPFHSMPIPIRRQPPAPPPPPIRSYLWQRGKLTPLGSLGGSNTVAEAINDRGQIVGTSDIRNGSRVPAHAFLWQNGKMTDLGTLGGRFSEPTAINEHGQVIGTGETASHQAHGFIWEHGKMTDLGTLGGAETRPVAINEHGQVIGQSTTPKRTAHHFDDGVAFLWRDGKMTNLGALGGRSSGATAIDDRGQIVGWSDTRFVPYTAQSQPRPRPFLWQNGKMIQLPTVFASPTRAVAIVPSGTEILGWANWPGNQALLWTRMR
jgi:probable HAF family extracellular repeat protein